MSYGTGRLLWEGIDNSSSLLVHGEIVLQEDDVQVFDHKVLRGHLMMNQRLRELGAAPAAEDIEKLAAEVERDPHSQELVETWYSKVIQLSPDYYLTFAEHPEKQPISGFGLTAGIGTYDPAPKGCRTVFSWEWFQVVDGGRAAKLQESGELEFQTAATARGVEITRMSFKSDVSLRAYEMGSFDLTSPRWRIKILEGSDICWPVG